jgi:hypothetical protein
MSQKISLKQDNKTSFYLLGLIFYIPYSSSISYFSLNFLISLIYPSSVIIYFLFIHHINTIKLTVFLIQQFHNSSLKRQKYPPVTMLTLLYIFSVPNL